MNQRSHHAPILAPSGAVAFVLRDPNSPIDFGPEWVYEADEADDAEQHGAEIVRTEPDPELFNNVVLRMPDRPATMADLASLMRQVDELRRWHQDLRTAVQAAGTVLSLRSDRD